MEWTMLFLAGLLGSSHCVGMCGGFAVLLGLNTGSTWKNCGAQCVYSLGRLFTYAVLGALAGFCGARLQSQWASYANIPAVLSILAGIFLIYQGLLTAGVRVWGQASSASAGCLAVPLLRNFLTSSQWLNRFLAGVLTGFLPCGLLYGALALSTSSRSVFVGAGMMLMFGVGTVPLMVLTGLGGRLLSVAARTRVLQVAAWCVVLTGMLTVARGAGYISLPGQKDPAGCPFCQQGIED